VSEETSSEETSTRRALTISPAEFHILLALADEDRHGYAIMQQVEAETGGAVTLGPGTLYGAIKRLVDGGLIRPSDEPDPGRDGRRKVYALTGRGREAVRAEAARLQALVRLARTKRVLEPAVAPAPEPSRS